MRAISGSWLIMGEASVPPMAAGAVVLDDAERVLAVGELAALRQQFPGLRCEEHAAVLMPGLVNAHTHLELSALRGAVPGGKGFAPWVHELVRQRSAQKPEQDQDAVEQAISELLGYGVVALGDVSNRLLSLPLLAAVPIVTCVFHEVFGLRREVADVMLGMAEAERAAIQAWPAHLRYALAPHTTYTLNPDVLRSILERNRARGARSSLHLAEHAAERAFLQNGGGPFAQFLAERSSTPPDWQLPGCDAISYAEQLGALAPDVIAVHLTDAKPNELARVAALRSPVVLCPRSNLHIELKLPPLLDVLAAGLRPGLGTDSLASNSSLDPLAEARALQKRFPTVSPGELLAMASAWGADALGLGGLLGRLLPGQYPGVLAFMHGAERPRDPQRFVLERESAERRMLSRPSYMRLPEEVFA